MESGGHGQKNWSKSKPWQAGILAYFGSCALCYRCMSAGAYTSRPGLQISSQRKGSISLRPIIAGLRFREAVVCHNFCFSCWNFPGIDINSEISVNVSAYYFPKHGPPRPKIYAPKTHTNRFRNYKVKPEGKMIHTLKLPSIPLSFYASCIMQVRKSIGCLIFLNFLVWETDLARDSQLNQTFTTSVQLHWTTPKSDGGTPITGYEISQDGTTWSDIGASLT
jgi:hypothetical protein